MMQKNPALQLFNDLWSDINEPNFIWQVLALIGCLVVAYVIAHWWRSRHAEGAGRLSDAGSRLVFPLTGMILVGAARLALKPFFHVNLLKLALPLLGSMALVRSVIFVLRQAFPRATWLTAWERIIAAVVWSWLALYITDLAPYVVDALEQVDFAIGKQRVDLWMILHGLITVFLTVVLALWVAGIIEARLMRIDTLDSSLRIVGIRVAKALLTVLAIVSSLSLVGIDMTALSVFTGALGVGLGFGLQKIASNYVSGFIILLDRSIRLGNIIQVGSEGGQVTQITTRYTVLKHPGGTEYIVPNETLIGSVVQNQTYSDSSLRLTTTVGVAYDSDLDLAMRLMVEAAAAQARVQSEPPPKVFLTQFADSSINLELGFWIEDPEGGKGNVVSDINLAIWKSFRAHGVEIPFPQRDVRIVNEKTAA
ncbi:mechanosensitive ion channel family protein [Quatrionicoccus australiensis]|uniref:mechanosensitive ion channel family protein n=1 Tax=Quatrionicoccus australiensis TaxID=138118 RepID=UPI001CF89C03|nr:mechanosensitive ion channel domain-containing protein [Quatrionicoccus australiensis]UCV16232.1 mechanosensitive ion channel [Quatrionicoccus australiensis]